MTKVLRSGQLHAVIPLRQALLISLLCLLPFLSAVGEPDAYPRVYRTFMPESGPSAFAVELSPQLALCYDPLRGGVNRIWKGGIDLTPTRQDRRHGVLSKPSASWHSLPVGAG